MSIGNYLYYSESGYDTKRRGAFRTHIAELVEFFRRLPLKAIETKGESKTIKQYTTFIVRRKSLLNVCCLPST